MKYFLWTVVLLIMSGCSNETGSSSVTVSEDKTTKTAVVLQPLPLPKSSLEGMRFSATLKVRSGQGKKLTCILIHDNETSAAKAADQVCKKIVYLDNGQQRNVTLFHDGARYTFDPNRIFTPAGIEKTLQPYNKAAALVVADFAKQIIDVLGTGHIVALHNNTHGRYSITSYLSGGSEALAAEAVHIEPTQSPDDFVLVSTEDEFHYAQHQQVNVVLLKRVQPDDGSLSVFCAKRCLSYTNVETEHGKTSLQVRIVKQLYQ